MSRDRPRVARGERGGLAVLVDPARTTPDEARVLAARAADEGAAALLIGTSFGGGDGAPVARALKAAAPTLPLLQFPATAAELIADVDAVLFLTLVSGRNAQYLIEEQVRAVPFVERHPELEVIATAYCLVDGGRVTSVESVSQTRPLPADKPEILAAHVPAAMLLGIRATYIDAGSGAARAVSPADDPRGARGGGGAPLRGGRRAQRGRRARGARGGGGLRGGRHRIRAGGTRAVRELVLAARA